MTTSQQHEPVYARVGDSIFYNQLGIKIAVDSVPVAEYFAWLDEMKANCPALVPGAEIAEKPDARVSPSKHTAIYYDTADLQILPTGALLRATTKAYCTFKAPADGQHIRRDQRYVFTGADREVIQRAPDSPEGIAVVKRLLSRHDIDHPGTQLRKMYGIDPASLEPAVRLDDSRYTFYVWLDGRDALRCSLDCFKATNLRLAEQERRQECLVEVELSIYPRIAPETAQDPRLPEVMNKLADSLRSRFGVGVTELIKYQRAARALGMGM